MVAYPPQGTEQRRPLWIPATGGTESYQSGPYTGYRIDADGEDAYMTIRMPYDFNFISELTLVYFAVNGVANQRLDVTAWCGAAGEGYGTHQGTHNFTRTTTGGDIDEDDISSAVHASVSAGDTLGIRVYRPASGNSDCCILGVYFRYG